MNMILRELKSIRRALIIWSGSMIFLIYVGMVKYSGFRDAGESVADMMESLPAGMKAVFGIGVLDLTKASGYYIVFFLYFALLCGVHAIMQGSVVISKEVRDKTADFLMVKPVKRKEVVTSKIIASIISVLILNAVTWISSIVIVGMYNNGDSINGLINKLMLALLLIQLIFLSLGLLMGSVMSTTKKAAGASTAILLGSFIISVVVDIYSKLKFLKYLSPFKYFDGKSIFMSGFDAKYVILTVIIIVVSIFLTYKLFQRKDLHV